MESRRRVPLLPVARHQVLVGVDAVLDGGVFLRPLNDEPQRLVEVDGSLVVREDREFDAFVGVVLGAELLFQPFLEFPRKVDSGLVAQDFQVFGYGDVDPHGRPIVRLPVFRKIDIHPRNEIARLVFGFRRRRFRDLPTVVLLTDAP